jgi:hypothetical protein
VKGLPDFISGVPERGQESGLNPEGLSGLDDAHTYQLRDIYMFAEAIRRLGKARIEGNTFEEALLQFPVGHQEVIETGRRRIMYDKFIHSESLSPIHPSPIHPTESGQ